MKCRRQSTYVRFLIHIPIPNTFVVLITTTLSFLFLSLFEKLRIPIIVRVGIGAILVIQSKKLLRYVLGD